MLSCFLLAAKLYRRMQIDVMLESNCDWVVQRTLILAAELV